MLHQLLTPAEYLEYTDNPPRLDVRHLTDEQFATRLAIAKKLCRFFLNEDHDLTDDTRAIYESHPMWGFYVNKCGARCPRRAYGVCIDAERRPRLHACTAHIGWTNDVVGGVPTDDVRMVDRWDDEAMSLIQLCNAPGVFVDPLGFLLPLEQEAK